MLIDHTAIAGILSIKQADLGMRPLTVLTGTNSTGKSNFIRATSLLQDLADPFRKPPRPDILTNLADPGEERTATINTVLQPSPEGPVTAYAITLEEVNDTVHIAREEMEIHSGPANERSNHQAPTSPTRSLLANPANLPDKARPPHRALSRTRIFQHCDTRPQGMARNFRRFTPGTPLRQDPANLHQVLADISQGATAQDLNRNLRVLDPDMERLEGRAASLYLMRCTQARTTPVAHLSDGTIRYLALMAVLCHPSPPPLVAIGQPETHLHPDVHRHLAQAILRASTKTQFIVQTHSPELLDTLRDKPQTILRSLRTPTRRTTLSRLDPEGPGLDRQPRNDNGGRQ